MGELDKSGIAGLGEEKLFALVEMMFLAASADGEFSATEKKYFVEGIESLTDGRLGKPKLEELLGRAQSDLAAHGREARLKDVKSRLPDARARKVALALAIQVTAADGIIRTSERELILETAEALEIDRDEAANMVRDLVS
jgi:tellurite resistance protein